MVLTVDSWWPKPQSIPFILMTLVYVWGIGLVYFSLHFVVHSNTTYNSHQHHLSQEIICNEIYIQYNYKVQT